MYMVCLLCIYTPTLYSTAKDYSLLLFLPLMCRKRRKMNEGWTKDERRIIEGYTAEIRRRYGAGTEEPGLWYYGYGTILRDTLSQRPACL